LKILITGISGMLGVDLYQTLREKYEVVGFDLKEFPSTSFLPPSVQRGDIARIDEVRKAFNELAPQMVVHTAAHTDVDGCERDPDRAYKVNALGTQNVCLACQDLNIPLMYISTDFVFDGNKDSPYLEFDQPHPISIYGRSKLAGEEYVKTLLNKYFIVRTSWLYGHYGRNFIETILELARQKKELKVVNDQVGSPTYTRDLSRKIKELLPTELYGIYHITNSGNCSWYEFAREILRLAGIREVELKPITSEELDRPAPRPRFSVLENYCLRVVLGNSMREWKEALEDYLREHLHCVEK
jgi:dTDP-4-dehydrorhamnose reductase